MILALTLAACNTGKIGSGKTQMVTPRDSMAYAYGVDMGKGMKQQNLDLNVEAFAAGLADGQGEDELKLNDDQIRQLVMAFQEEARKKQVAAMQAQQKAQQSSAKVKVGEVAPDITLDTPEGEKVSLSDFRGKYVLVDFWASWCKPCRAENPNVVRVYNKYKSKGFEILGVSLDRARDPWLKAIKDDGLEWPHISDLGFWNSKAAQDYGVKSIPYTVLVDKEGKVIAERLRGTSLEAKLAEIFGS